MMILLTDNYSIRNTLPAASVHNRGSPTQFWPLTQRVCGIEGVDDFLSECRILRHYSHPFRMDGGLIAIGISLNWRG